MLAAFCGFDTAHHDQLTAAAPILALAMKPLAVELIEFFSMLQQAGHDKKPCCRETEKSLFLDLLLTTMGAAGKQQKTEYFQAAEALGGSWVIGS